MRAARSSATNTATDDAHSDSSDERSAGWFVNAVSPLSRRAISSPVASRAVTTSPKTAGRGRSYPPDGAVSHVSPTKATPGPANSSNVSGSYPSHTA